MAGEEVRVVKTETGHAGRGRGDYSIPGKELVRCKNFKGGFGSSGLKLPVLLDSCTASFFYSLYPINKYISGIIYISLFVFKINKCISGIIHI